jgi:hypothetical protein
MPGASDRTTPVTIVNANWAPDPAGGDGRFEIMLVTEDDERHAFPVSPAAMAALLALTRTEPVLMWDPVNRTLIAANIVGEMPWTQVP